MKNILILYGGNSNEHEISCKSMKFIVDNIDKSKYNFTCVKITKDNVWIENNMKIKNIINYLKKFDVIFPILHGKNGEDGKLQGMLELFNIKYVGCNCETSSICMNKIRTKEILNYYNIPQVQYQIYNENFKLNIDYPVIIKPANSGSSIGINVANNDKEFDKYLKEAQKYDSKIIIEKFLKVRELECAILKNNNLIISNIGEIISNNTFYDYDTKYKNNSSELVIPANIPKPIYSLLEYYVKEIDKILELKDLSRIDFFYDELNNKIYLNEINTMPGFTKISMFPRLILNKNINYKDLITILIENQK